MNYSVKKLNYILTNSVTMKSAFLLLLQHLSFVAFVLFSFSFVFSYSQFQKIIVKGALNKLRLP